MTVGDTVYVGLCAGVVTAIEGAYVRVRVARQPGVKASHSWYPQGKVLLTTKEAQHGRRHSNSTAHAADRRDQRRQ